MTLEEKVALCHAQGKFSSPGVPRLGIPELCYRTGRFMYAAEEEIPRAELDALREDATAKAKEVHVVIYIGASTSTASRIASHRTARNIICRGARTAS